MRSNAAALRAARERKGHTLVSLGEVSGVSFQRISDLEQTDTGVRPTTAKRLADALGCDIEDIATIDDPAEVAS
jgi:transcriptional regulator with XRE-family HTH domain